MRSVRWKVISRLLLTTTFFRTASSIAETIWVKLEVEAGLVLIGLVGEGDEGVVDVDAPAGVIGRFIGANNLDLDVWICDVLCRVDGPHLLYGTIAALQTPGGYESQGYYRPIRYVKSRKLGVSFSDP